MKVITKLKRYYRWKYSGPITVICGFLIAVPIWWMIASQVQFYDKFTCPMIMEYAGGDYGVNGQPDYDQLIKEQKEKFDILYQECIGLGWQPKG